MAAWETSPMMHFRLVGKKVLFKCQQCLQHPYRASLLQGMQHPGPTNQQMDLWGVWLPSLIVMCAQTSLSGSAHPACAHSQSNGKGSQSHCVVVSAKAQRQHGHVCRLHSLPTYTSTKLFTDLWFPEPRPQGCAEQDRAVQNHRHCWYYLWLLCWSSKANTDPQWGNGQLKLFRQVKNQELDLKTSRQTLRHVHYSGIKLNLHIEAHI